MNIRPILLVGLFIGVCLPLKATGQEGVIVFSGQDQETTDPALEPISFSKCVEPPKIALTFDDGPYPTHTAIILDILKIHGISATFFVVGRQVKSYPSIMRRIVAEGHEVGLHSYTHPNFAKISLHSQEVEIQQSLDAVQSVVPEALISLWRAPYGSTTQHSLNVSGKLGLSHSHWSVDSFDWRKPTDTVWMGNILPRVKDGTVILMHDHSAMTRQSLPLLITNLSDMGFVFRTVSALHEPLCE